MMNTKKHGSLTFFIFKEKKATDFIGVCLELGIVKEGENFEEVKKDLEEAAKGYVIAVCKNNLSDELLNQKPPRELMDLFKKFLSSFNSINKKQEQIKRPSFESATISRQQVADLCYA